MNEIERKVDLLISGTEQTKKKKNKKRIIKKVVVVATILFTASILVSSSSVIVSFYEQILESNPSIPISVGDEPEDSWWIYPEPEPYQIFSAPQINWSKCKPWLGNHIKVFLEGKLNSSEEWIQNNDYLIVTLDDIGNNTLKSTWIFDAPVAGDYRITILVDASTFNVSVTGEYEYTLSLDAFNETFNLVFNYSDLLQYSDLQFKQGRTDYNGHDVFYFRVRRDNVSKDTHVEFDPTYEIFSGASVSNAYGFQRKLARNSTGTLWACFEESADVHIAYSDDDGETWTDTEVCGIYPSYQSSLDIDSNDVVHLIWRGRHAGSTTYYQVRYANSSDWNNIVNLTDISDYHYDCVIAIDGSDNIHVAWVRDDSGTSNDMQIFYINSTDNGGSWGSIIMLTNEINFGDQVRSPSIAINSTGSIHIVFWCTDFANDKDQILHMKSDDCGITWSDWDGDPISNDAGYNQKFSCVAIADNDSLHVVWESQYSFDGESQICYSWNDSASWSAVEILASDSETDQYESSISVDMCNNIHLLWYAYPQLKYRCKYNDSVWSDIRVLGDCHGDPSILHSTYPVISGFKTNVPAWGFVGTYVYSGALYFIDYDVIWMQSDIPPIQHSPEPVLDEIVASRVFQFNISVFDFEGNLMNLTFRTNESGVWRDINATLLNKVNGTYNATNTSWITDSITYYWSVNATDGMQWNNKTYSFDALITNLTMWINFAGNLSDIGGPWYRPPKDDGVQLTGIWSDGYYTNDSRQQEDWIYINITVTDIDGVDEVWLHWLNETTWTNNSYQFVNTVGDYWEYNTSGNIQTCGGYNYSFDIWANDTKGNSDIYEWKKIGVSNDFYPVGITTDGNYFWILVNNWAGTVNDVFKYAVDGKYTGEKWSNSNCTGVKGITTDGNYFWIVSKSNKRVYKYNMTGVYQDSWSCASETGDPYGIVTNGTYIWITDDSYNEVFKYNMNGTYASESWDTTGSGNGDPRGISMNSTHFFVTDHSDRRIYRYNVTTGAYIDYWSTIQTGANLNPWGIETDGTYIWTVDRNPFNAKVYKRHMNGTFIDSWDTIGVPGDGSISNYIRRKVQLNCTPIGFSYVPYYHTYNMPPGGGSLDAMQHDQWAGSGDYGVFNYDLPGETVLWTWCGVWTGYWFDEARATGSFTLENAYFHSWWSQAYKDYINLELGTSRYAVNMGYPPYGEEIGECNSSWDDGHTYMQWDNEHFQAGSYYMLTTKFFDCPDTNFTDNNFYELLAMWNGNTPQLISNRSFTSFIIFNVPDNATLQGLDTDSDGINDYDELYTIYTNPFLADTDNDSVDDYVENKWGFDPNDYRDTPGRMVFANEAPLNNSYNVSLQPKVNVTINNLDGNSFTVDFYTSPDGSSWTHRQTNLSILNESISYIYAGATEYQTIYYWKVTANDTVYNLTSPIYEFETTLYRLNYFNDTFPNEKWINYSSNMTFESGWKNFTVGFADEFAFGKNSEGSYNTGIYCFWGTYVALEDGNIVSLTWELTPHTVDDDIKVAVHNYTDKSLLGQGTRENLGSTERGWYTIDLDSPVAVTAGTRYALGMSGSGDLTNGINTGPMIIHGESISIGGYKSAWRDTLRSYATFPTDPAAPTQDYQTTNISVYANYQVPMNNANFISENITKQNIYWNQFYANVDNRVNSTFSLVDPDTDYILLSGLTGDGDYISDITNDTVRIRGDFNATLSLASWNISWTHDRIPKHSGEFPTDESYNISLIPTVNVTITDGEGNATTCDFYTSPDGDSWTHRQTNSTVQNESISYIYTSATEYQTTYWWKVTANDGYNNVSRIYEFETTPYRPSFFNDTFPNENFIDATHNMTHEVGWENVTFISPSSGNFGKEDTGSTSKLLGSYGYTGNFIAPFTGTIKNITWDLNPSSSTCDIKVSVHMYESPYTLLAQGERIDLGSTARNWYTIELDTPLAVTAGTRYVLGGRASSTCSCYHDTVSVAYEQAWLDQYTSYANTPANPHPRDNTYNYRNFSVYATYEPESPVYEAYVLSSPIYKQDFYWDKFYADVNNTANSTFSLIDPDTDYVILSNLTGGGDEVGSVTNNTIRIRGDFNATISLASWNISWIAAIVPEQSGEVPANDSTGIGLQPQLYVLCSHAGDKNMNATWWWNNSGTWYQFASNWTSFPTDTNITQMFTNATEYSTKYWWSVNLTDGTHWTNVTYSFTTNWLPVFSNEVPENATSNIGLQPTVNVTIVDGDGHQMTCDFYTSLNGIAWTHRQTNLTVLNESIQYDYVDASDYETTYYWKVTANDTYNNVSVIYHFTTLLPPPIPILTSEYPTNTSIRICPCVVLGIDMTVRTGYANITFYYSENTTVFTLLDSYINVTNATYYVHTCQNMTHFNTTYHWYVYAENYDNTSLNVTSPIYQFTTAISPEDCLIVGGAGSVDTGIAMGVMGGVLGGLIGSFIFMKKKKKKRGPI